MCGVSLFLTEPPKGNLYLVRVGGSLKNHRGEILWLQCRFLGESTNNSAECGVVLEFINISLYLQIEYLIVERDS